MQSKINFVLLQKQGIFWTGLSMTILFFVLMASSCSRLDAENGAPGLIDLEIAPSSGRVSEILSQWEITKGHRLEHLRRGIWLDFGFILGYGLTLMAAAAYLFADSPKKAQALIWIALLAAAFDVIENAGLLRTLSAVRQNASLPAEFSPLTLWITAAASHAKWLLLAWATLQLLVALFARFKRLPRFVSVFTALFLSGMAVFLLKYFLSVPGSFRVG